MTRWSSSTFFLARPKVPSCCHVSLDLMLCVCVGSTYSLLGELTGTLVLAVSEQLNDSALVGGKTVRWWLANCCLEPVSNRQDRADSPMEDFPNGSNAFPICPPLASIPNPLPSYPQRKSDLPSNLLDDLTDESGALAQVTLGPGDTGLDDTGSGFL